MILGSTTTRMKTFSALTIIMALVAIAYSVCHPIADKHDAPFLALAAAPPKVPTAVIPSPTALSSTAVTLNPCEHVDPIALYQQLSNDEWRALNDWQQDLGLNQTRLLANGDITQELSPYAHMDDRVLHGLAHQHDANALYWLAIHLQQSNTKTARYDAQDEDKTIVVARLLQEAALLGHVPAIQALVQSLQQQIATFGQREQFPDWAIRARAWQWLIAWRMQQLPEASEALSTDNEVQALNLTQQMIRDIEQRRQQLQLPPLNNQRPAVIARLSQSATDCEPAHNLVAR